MSSRLVHRFVAFLVVLAPLLSFLLALSPSPAAEETKGIPEFRVQEIEKGLGVGYAVLLVDVNNDGKKDIVVADQKRVVWYENPSWQRRNIIEGKTEPDNVCIAAADIDGDGQLDFALGAAWNPSNTKSGGTLQWLKRGKTLDEPWSVHPIGEEPTLHRIRFADLDSNGKPVLLVVPLMGRDSTAAKNHMDGQPVRLLAYRIPKDPLRDRWPVEVLDQSMHVIHNFQAIPPLTLPSPPAGGEGRVRGASGKGMDVLTASYEGVGLLHREGEKWTRRQLGTGDQSNPKSNRGASEIKRGKLKNGQFFLATIEPWHGDKVVVYTPPTKSSGLWDRHVLDDKLKWGHAVWCADLDGDGGDELIIGIRDVLSDRSGENCGVRIFKAIDDKGAKWQRHLLDEGGVRVEDLAAADLDGDGRIDLVAVGRQSHNARIYWNKGTK